MQRKERIVPLLCESCRDRTTSELRLSLTVLPIFHGTYVYRFARPAEQKNRILVSE